MQPALNPSLRMQLSIGRTQSKFNTPKKLQTKSFGQVPKTSDSMGKNVAYRNTWHFITMRG